MCYVLETDKIACHSIQRGQAVYILDQADLQFIYFAEDMATDGKYWYRYCLKYSPKYYPKLK